MAVDYTMNGKKLCQQTQQTTS